jgi:two-component system, OmpR family, KDP operon response regulator KdpE
MTLSKRPTILIVEDDAELVCLLQIILYSEKFEVLLAYDGCEGLDKFRAYHPDLVILDVRMPCMDGMETCRRIRETSDVPIIMLTCVADEMDKVRGLTLGADDYVTKPFSKNELMARVWAALRRGDSLPRPSSTIHVDDRLAIDPVAGKVWLHGKRVPLTATEYRLLMCLIYNAGRISTRQSLLTQVWGWEYMDQNDYLKVHICHLRKKIEPDPQQPRYILTERGLGYRFQFPQRS